MPYSDLDPDENPWAIWGAVVVIVGVMAAPVVIMMWVFSLVNP